MTPHDWQIVQDARVYWLTTEVCARCGMWRPYFRLTELERRVLTVDGDALDEGEDCDLSMVGGVMSS